MLDLFCGFGSNECQNVYPDYLDILTKIIDICGVFMCCYIKSKCGYAKSVVTRT